METSLVFVTISDSVPDLFVNFIVTIVCLLVCMLNRQPLEKKKQEITAGESALA